MQQSSLDATNGKRTFDSAKRGILNGNIDVVTEAALGAARGAVEVGFDLVGVMASWCGFAAGGGEYDASGSSGGKNW